MASLLIPLLLCAAGSLLAEGGAPPKAEPPKSAPTTAVPPQQEQATDTQPNPEELILSRAIPYAPKLERDPFGMPSEAEDKGKGDSVDDIGVKGMVISDGVRYAVATDSRGNMRRLPVGFRLKDGEIAAIGDKSVTFRQWDPDSTNRRVFRTVVKSFKREEGKR